MNFTKLLYLGLCITGVWLSLKLNVIFFTITSSICLGGVGVSIIEELRKSKSPSGKKS